uniref:TonB-dependent receptor domain-containing protein n=1 Tax=Flavobacterium sp. TaxID=239 RepID=UPI0037537282
EKNSTIETGFEVNLLDKKLNFNAVGFYREQNNTIGFYFDNMTFVGQYVTIEGVNKAKGVETELSYAVNSKVKLNTNYTFTQVDEALDRLIPKHKINASLDFQASKKLFLNANYQYVDARKDAFFDGTTFAVANVNLSSYRLFNGLIKYELVKNRLTIFGAATNIFNEDFVENIGYSTRGRNFRLGLNINL